MRRVAFRIGVSSALAAALAPAAMASPPATRLVFAATVERQQTQIFSIAPSGRSPAQLTFGSSAASSPVPSPDGTRIAFVRGNDVWVMRADGRGQRLLARNGAQPAWAPSSRRLAYVSVDDEGLSLGIRSVGRDGTTNRWLVHGRAVRPTWSPDGRSLAFGRDSSLVVRRGESERMVLTDPEIFGVQRIGWSYDGRWLAFADFGRTDVVRSDGRGVRVLPGGLPSWAPHRSTLAYAAGGNAIHVFDPSTGRERQVTSAHSLNSLSWSPRGDAIAASGGTYLSEDLSSQYDALIVSTLTGHAQNRAHATDPYALPDAVAWTKSPPNLRLRRPTPIAPRVVGNELQSREPIADLAADGARVAYRYCGTIGVWSPGDPKLVSVQTDHPPCVEANLGFWNVALAGDRIAWGRQSGGNSQIVALLTQSVGDTSSRVEVAIGTHTTGDQRGDERAGELLGSGSLLVFSTWAYCDEVQPIVCPGVPYGRALTIVSQKLWRVRDPSWAGACPTYGFAYQPPTGRCQDLRAESGPLRVLDVNAGRIVVSGDNATLVLDADGGQLLSIPVSTAAAQLTGSDLVVLVPGELRDYDVTTGVLRHSWPLPDASFAGFCGVPLLFCGSPRIRLEDAAGGLVAYLLDGQLHVLRLADGRDVVVHAATAARFDDSGLVYAYTATGLWPGRIRFVSFAGIG